MRTTHKKMLETKKTEKQPEAFLFYFNFAFVGTHRTDWLMALSHHISHKNSWLVTHNPLGQTLSSTPGLYELSRN